MDNGRLTDHHGKTVDFRNVILIMTTNAGASDMAREAVGFGAMTREGEDEEAIKRMFTPEFRNRLDAIVPFGYLPPDVVARVVEKFILSSRCSWPTARSISSSTRRPRSGSPTAAMTALRSAPDGPAGPGEDQAAARRGAAVRQAGQRRRGEGPDQGQRTFLRDHSRRAKPSKKKGKKAAQGEAEQASSRKNRPDGKEAASMSGPFFFGGARR
jgi:hypothetical protein